MFTEKKVDGLRNLEKNQAEFPSNPKINKDKNLTPDIMNFDSKNAFYNANSQHQYTSHRGSVCKIQLDLEKINFGRESLYDMDIKPKSPRKNFSENDFYIEDFENYQLDPNIIDNELIMNKLDDQEKYICKSEMLEKNEQLDFYNPVSKVNFSAPEDQNYKFDPRDPTTISDVFSMESGIQVPTSIVNIKRSEPNDQQDYTSDH